MAFYYQGETVAMPLTNHFQSDLPFGHNLPNPYEQNQFVPYATLYNQPLAQYEPSYAPPLPPKEPIDSMWVAQPGSPSSIDSSLHGFGSQSPPSLPPRLSIEPDLLPPHSNPQALSQTQSQAFTGSNPIPPVRLMKDKVVNMATGAADFTIERDVANLQPFSSAKPPLTVLRTNDAMPIGNVHFPSTTSKSIELTINGRKTAITHSGMWHNRWSFVSPNPAERWFWKKDKNTGGAMLEDAKKHGRVLARMKGDVLTFEKARLNKESYDEVVISALAMAEAARRQKRRTDIPDLANAIGNFASSDGSGGGDGNDRGDSGSKGGF